MNNRKIVITGSTGAIGMALIEKCIQEKTEVLAICHKGSRRNDRIPVSPYVKVLEANLDEWDGIDHLADSRYNVFCHLAWSGTYGAGRDDMQMQIRNIQYTVSAVDLAARLGCDTFIGVGSQAEYGRVEGVLTPKTPAFPENGYGMAKLCAGQMSRKLCAQRGMRHIWVRVLSVYGPYDRAETMVNSSLLKMLRGEPVYFTAGEQIWDFLYSKDAAEALWRLAEKGKDGRVYCLGSGRGAKLKDYIMEMHRLTGERSMVHMGAIPYAQGQVMQLCADISALREDVGFIPQYGFREGILDTIEWIKRNSDVCVSAGDIDFCVAAVSGDKVRADSKG